MSVSAAALPARDIKLRRRDRQREETRSRVFDAALAEFQRVGFSEARIEDIVGLAGVACGTFYFHFPTKDHVLVELQRRSQESIVKRLEALRRRPLTVKVFLRRLIDALIAESALGGQSALRHEIFALYARQPTALKGQDNNPLAEAVMEFFRGAQVRGQMRSDLSPSELMMIFLSSVFGVLISQEDPLGSELRPLLKRVVDVFVRGVRQ